jgi:iron(III) transport system permease protein
MAENRRRRRGVTPLQHTKYAERPLEAIFRPERLLTAAAIAISALVLIPVLTIVLLALTPAPGVWAHLIGTVLPFSVRQTLLLLAGVGLLTLVTGTGTAWLVTMYDFPGRRVFDWLLVLPLALPTYISAYCYGEFLDFTGPPQTALRALFGFTHYQDYWFPNVRTLGGAIFIMSAVLYPYVYLAARASFLQQSHNVLEVARTLGRSGFGAFVAVGLPMARPALAAGISLALMECLNDIGAVEYLGVQTLTASIYAAWLQRSSLAGAAQIALVLFAFVLALVLIERWARLKRRFDNSSRQRLHSEQNLSPVMGWLAAAACALPVLTGFAIPVSVLLQGALQYGAAVSFADYARAASTSFFLALITAVLVVVLATTVGAALRLAGGLPVQIAARLAALGYAIPGTVVALGVVIPLAAADNALSDVSEGLWGIKTGLLLSGTAFGLILAYVIRFLAVGLGPVEAGWQRLSPNLDAAARTLGAGPAKVLRAVHLPLLRPALGAAALLVFVDTMKELSATLLLRPFDFETLATQIYVFASQEQFERSAIPALIIVAVGMIPLLLLNRTMQQASPGRLLRHSLSTTPDSAGQR